MALKTTQHCPHCRGQLLRIQRKTSDRLLSLFVGLKRYQCQNDVCAWEGTLHVPNQR